MGCCFSKELNPNLVSERTSLLQAAIPEGSAAKDVRDCAWSVADLADEKPSQNGNVNAALDTSCNASSTNLSAGLNLIKEGGSSVQEGMAFWDPPVGDPPIHEAIVQKGNASRNDCLTTETLDSVKQRIAENAIMRAKWFCEGQQNSTELTRDDKSKSTTLGQKISPSCILKDQHSKEEQVKTLWDVQSKPASTPKHATPPFNKCFGSSINLDDSEEGNSGLLITDRGFKKEQSFYSICLIDLEDLGSECGHQPLTEADAVRYASAPAVSEKALFDNSLLPKGHTISGSRPSHETTQQTETDPSERTTELGCSTSLPVDFTLPNEENALPDLLKPLPTQENEKNVISASCTDTEVTLSPSTAVEDAIDQLSPDLLSQNGQMSVLKSSTDTVLPQGEPADLLNNSDLYSSSGYKAADLESGSEFNVHNTISDESMLRPPQQDLNGSPDESELEDQCRNYDNEESMKLNLEKIPNVDCFICSLSNTTESSPNLKVAIVESDQCVSKKTPTEEVLEKMPPALSAVSASVSEKLVETEDQWFSFKDASEDIENLKFCSETPLTSDKEDKLSKSASCCRVEVGPRQIATQEEVILNPCQSSILQNEGQTNDSDMFKVAAVAQSLSSPSHAESVFLDQEDKLDMTSSTHIHPCGVFPTDQTKIVSESCDSPNGEQNVEPNANFADAEPCDMNPSPLPTNPLVNFEHLLEVAGKSEEDDYRNVVDNVHTNSVPGSDCPGKEDLFQSNAIWFVNASHTDVYNKGHSESIAASYLIQVGLGSVVPATAQEQVMDNEIGETCLQYEKTHFASKCFSEDEQKVLAEICLCADDGETKMSELEPRGLVTTSELLNCLNDGNNNNDCLETVCSASSDVQTLSQPPCQSEVLETCDCSSLSINCTRESACQYLDSSTERPASDTWRSSVTSIQEHGDLQDMGEIRGDVVDCSIPLVSTVSTARLSLETAQSCAVQGHGSDYAPVESLTTTVSQLIPSSLGVLDFGQSDLKVITDDVSDNAAYVNAAIPLPVEPDQVDIYATLPSYEIYFLNKDQFAVPVQVENPQVSDEMEGEQGMLNMVSDLLGKSELSDEVDSSHCLSAWAKEPHVLFSDNQTEACALVSAWGNAVSEAGLTMQNDEQNAEEGFQTSVGFIAPYPYNLLGAEGSCVWDWQNAYSEL
ncbi:hypothetical protein M9458_047778, partial [Cirrhinus mrigala]